MHGPEWIARDERKRLEADAAETSSLKALGIIIALIEMPLVIAWILGGGR